MIECDVKHFERLRRYKLKVVYHPEWGAAVVHAAGVGRDIPGLALPMLQSNWNVPSIREYVTEELLDRAEGLLDDLPEPKPETPIRWTELGAIAWAILTLPFVAIKAIWRP